MLVFVATKGSRSAMYPAALAAAVLLYSTGAEACKFSNRQPDGAVMGFNIYNNRLIVMVGRTTGTQLPAYQGLSTLTREDCIRSCIGEEYCTAIVWRPLQKPRVCLKYSRINFATQERMKIKAPGVWLNAHYLIWIRDTYSGRRCDQ